MSSFFNVEKLRDCNCLPEHFEVLKEDEAMTVQRWVILVKSGEILFTKIVSSRVHSRRA